MVKRDKVERNIKMFKAVALGALPKNVGKDEGISGGRVIQIIESMRRMLSTPTRLSGDVPPDGIGYGIKDLRNNADFWIKQINKFDVKNDPYIIN